MDEVVRELIDFECRLRKSSTYRWALANPTDDPRDEFRSSRSRIDRATRLQRPFSLCR